MERKLRVDDASCMEPECEEKTAMHQLRRVIYWLPSSEKNE